MSAGAVLYIPDGLSDGDLLFRDGPVPESLRGRLDALSAFETVVFAAPADYRGRLEGDRLFRRDDRDDISFWKRVFESTGCDELVKIFADSPFLDTAIIAEMLDLHRKYQAEFTYSENLPSGFSSEIMSRRLLDSIPPSDKAMVPLGDVVRSNINQFDAELYYREPDIRDKRLSFRSGDPRERRIMENLYSLAGKTPDYGAVRELINKNPEVLFVGPSYVEVELTGRCDLDCLFCFRNSLRETHGDMEPELYRKLLDELDSFGLPYSLCLGGSGEPLMHKNFYEILGTSLEHPGLKNLVIETNGIGADGNFQNFIRNGDPRVSVIVNVNGMDSETYSRLHGKDEFEKVKDNVIGLKEAFGGRGGLYLQIMKINETEPFLDRYYDYWEKVKIPIILQKQNTFLGRIADRRYSDLSPLERVPCWHLQRDLTVLWDGRVCFCRQDVDGDHARGRLGVESLETIWKNSLQLFIDDYRRAYPHAPDCASCDEWYTFNF